MSEPAMPESRATVPSIPLTTGPVPLGRSLVGGLLMGLANLVPGVSGGTLILALGLYERFIGAIAAVTRLRFTKAHVLFLALVLSGAAVSIVGLSGVVVDLVTEQRWVMYALFTGLALGGVPDLGRASRPLSGGVAMGALAGLALMAWIAFGGGEQRAVAPTPQALVFVGALAASSMILPGISGSYVLLILGLYDTVIGSLSSSELRDDFSGALMIIAPVGVGAVLGVALLSNALKALLVRAPRVTHAVLLGLLVGSVFGLYPFQQPVHAELAQRPMRKAVTRVLAGDEAAAAAARYEVDLGAVEALAARWSGLGAGELKREADRLEHFDPGLGRVAGALALAALGFAAARLLGARRS